MGTLKTTITTPEDILRIIKPVHDRVIIIRDMAPTHSKVAGLDIAHAKEKPNTGTIVAIGKRVMGFGNPDPKRVMFGRHAGTEVTINGIMILILREQDCFMDMDTLVPFHDKVVIRPDPMPKEIRGIIIPDNVHDQPQAGTVISTGSRCENVLPGERVLFGKFAGMFITPQEEEFLVLRELDIIAGL